MTTATQHRLDLVGTGGELTQIDVGATFLTGVEVDVAAVLANPGRPGPGTSLESGSTVPFHATSTRSSPGTTFYAVKTPDHGVDVVPRTLATVDPQWLLAQCGGDGTVVPAGWEIASATCEIFDFGVGCLVLRWRPTARRDVTPDELVGVVHDVETATGLVVTTTIAAVADACVAALQDDPARLDLAEGLVIRNSAVLPPTGSALWYWNLVSVRCSQGEQADLAASLGKILCPNTFEMLVHRDHAFAASTHVSVACSVAGRESDATFILRTVQLQDPWWTLYWRLDRVLLALQLSLEADIFSQRPKDLKARARLLDEVTSRVNLLRSRLDSSLVSSGARDIACWDALATAWDTPFRIEVVQKKMSLLNEAYAQSLARIASTQASRVNFMLYVFTALSVVASVVAVAQFTQGVVDQRIEVRLGVVLLSVVAALAAVLLSIRTTRVTRERTRARP